jgi:ATP-dependent RNA helicase HrpB
MLSALPIDEILPALLSELRHSNSIVLHAPAGAGKTTRVPVALLDGGIVGDGRIIMLEPRRIAARTAARRMSSERGERVGRAIGYRMRFENRIGPDTRVEVVTEGVLLRRLLDDPFLEGVDVVIFDEFHERRLDSDLALAMTRRVQQTMRPTLKLVVMSATLEPAPIAAWLGDCPIVASEGRVFPVSVEYLRRVERLPIPVLAARGVERMLQRSDGDVLVFLPGVGEIMQTQRELGPLSKRHNLEVMPLFGDLPSEDQDRVLSPVDRRKVVLATNVAETSVTIEGITAVVDTGVARQMQFDSGAGLDRLELVPISKASADQRTGRAGRTAPGACLRLWEESTHRHRPTFETSELQRIDLSSAVLRLADWGEADPAAFAWYESPSASSVEHAERLLNRLGAIGADGITDLGRAMVRLPVQPRLARLVIEGNAIGIPERVALLAAMLSERDPFVRQQDRRVASRRKRPQTTVARRSRSDVLDRLLAVEECLNTGRLEFDVGSFNSSIVRTIAKSAEQILRLLQATDCHNSTLDVDQDEAVLRAIAAGYTDRIARRREPGSERGLMVGGRGVRRGPYSAVAEALYFACVDVDGRGVDATVRQGSEVQLDWLPDALFSTTDHLFFHPSQKKVVARRRRMFDDLVLDESPVQIEDDDAAGNVLYQAARTQLRSFLVTGEEADRFITRVNCLVQWMPELNLPAFDESRLQSVLQSLCRQSRSFAQLKKADWIAALKGCLDWSQLEVVEREAPDRLQMPGGSKIRLLYEIGRSPVLAVRIQQLFGSTDTPRIAGGRIPLLLHLLAPNMRPQQVTDDLAGFWANTYGDVRRDLKRRYPKHAWPEDPSTASPVRRR